jgi:hypothetical protein
MNLKSATLSLLGQQREVSLSIDTIVERTAEVKVVGYEPLNGRAVFVDVCLVISPCDRDGIVLRD